MPTESEWEQATQRLIDLTESGQLKWEVNAHIKSQRENVEGDVYLANVQGRFIAVYEYKYQYYDEESSSGTSGWEMRNEVAIEFVDAIGVLQYRWPAVPGRWRLLDAIRCLVSGAQAFLKTFLTQPAGKEGVW